MVLACDLTTISVSINFSYKFSREDDINANIE